MRWLALALLAVVASVAAVFLLRNPPPAPSVAVSEAPPGATTTPAAPGVADPAAAEKVLARQKLLQMKEAMDKVRPARVIVESRPERRAGESEAFFKERTRALAEFDHFIRDAHLTPEQQQALMGVMADAQDNWRLALQSAHKKQPEAPGAEMADPVLSHIYQQINQEAQRAAEAAIDSHHAMIFHSYVPSMLPFLRTNAFEVAK